MRGGLPEEKNVAQIVRENTTVWGRKYQGLLDRSTPHVTERWLLTFGLFLVFCLNVVFRQGVSLSILGHVGKPDTMPRGVLCNVAALLFTMSATPY